jgi:CheY-like chemotaxis protein
MNMSDNESDKKTTILVVDDQPENIDVLIHALQDKYNVKVAISGARALQVAEKNPDLDLVLLDVMMPEMDGYETCRRLKSNPVTKNVSVIFVSGMDSTEDVISGYEAGGSDYMFKPIQPDVLLKKVRLAITNKQQLTDFESQKNMAVGTAMTALSSNGEQGVVLSFMRKSFTIDSIGVLAKHVIDSVQQYGLNSSVQLRTLTETVNASKSEPMSPLEKEFLFRVQTVGRLREKGGYFIVNYGNITLLVKDMPEDDDKRGRLRDHLALLLEGASARLKALAIQQELMNIVKTARQSLKQIGTMQSDHKEQVLETMDDVMDSLEASFMSYGLTEDQEEKLLDVVSMGVEKTIIGFEKSIKIDEKMKDIIDSLERFTQY